MLRAKRRGLADSMERRLAELQGSAFAAEIEAVLRAARGFGRELGGAEGSGQDAAIVELCTELGLRRDSLVAEAREELQRALLSDGVTASKRTVNPPSLQLLMPPSPWAEIGGENGRELFFSSAELPTSTSRLPILAEMLTVWTCSANCGGTPSE